MVYAKKDVVYQKDKNHHTKTKNKNLLMIEITGLPKERNNIFIEEEKKISRIQMNSLLKRCSVIASLYWQEQKLR